MKERFTLRCVRSIVSRWQEDWFTLRRNGKQKTENAKITTKRDNQEVKMAKCSKGTRAKRKRKRKRKKKVRSEGSKDRKKERIRER